jgi:hypothetical protein
MKNKLFKLSVCAFLLGVILIPVVGLSVGGNNSTIVPAGIEWPSS